jgi:hypothetical protein
VVVVPLVGWVFEVGGGGGGDVCANIKLEEYSMVNVRRVDNKRDNRYADSF